MSLIQTIIVNILRLTVISSILILFILLLKKTWLKNYNKNLNYYIWLFVIFRLIIPIEIPIKYTFSKKTNINRASETLVSIQNGIQLDTYFYIFIFYLVGVIILSIYSIATYLKYIKLIKKVSYNVDENLKLTLDKVKNEMNINKNIEVRYCDYVKSACLIGIFKNYVLLPNVKYNDSEAYWILKHELTHYKYKDNLLKLICFLIRIVYWFNPLIYLLIKKVGEDCELACDERVISNKTFEQKKQYALTIANSVKYAINFEEKLENQYYIGLSNSKKLKNRLQDLFIKNPKKGYFISVVILAITLSSFVNVKFDYLVKTNYYKKNVTIINTYTYKYKDAPKAVREFYEDECRANGVKPKDNDTIEITEDTLKRLHKSK